MKRFFLLLLALSLMPMLVYGAETPLQISAASAILVEASSGRVLYEKDADTQRLIASTTKLMTALVAVEHEPDLTQVVTIASADTQTEGSSMYLKVGEEITLETLLYGLLLSSGNDAALAIARHCAGDVETFVDWMNEKAVDLGMTDSQFQNPNGLNDDAHFSTARDMSKLAVACMESPVVADIVGTQQIALEGRTLSNHNKLLSLYEGCVGMKTGYTELAGRTLVSAAERNGQMLVCITLNAPDDWNDHSTLFDYGFEVYPSQTFVEANQTFGPIQVEGSLIRQVTLTATETVQYPIKSGETVEITVDLPGTLVAPVMQGQIVGTVSCYVNGACIGQSPLVASQDVANHIAPEQGFWARLFS